MKVLPKIVFFFGVGAFVVVNVWGNFHSAIGPSGVAGGSEPTSPTVQVVISILVLAASLTVILLKRYSPKDKHWAYATVGTILGFWLNSK